MYTLIKEELKENQEFTVIQVMNKMEGLLWNYKRIMNINKKPVVITIRCLTKENS